MAVISTARLMELEASERKLKAIERKHEIAWVGLKLGEVYAITLATKPWTKWTDAEKTLLQNICGNATTARALYIDNLPKE